MGGKWRNGYKRPNPEHDKVVRRDHDRRMYKQNRVLYRKLKGTLSCKLCPEAHPATLDFHHRDPNEKSFEVSTKIWSRTWKRILAEIEKCDVLCANCHRKLHWTED